MNWTTLAIRGSDLFTDQLTITESGGVLQVTGTVTATTATPWSPVTANPLTLPTPPSTGVIIRWCLTLNPWTHALTLTQGEEPRTLTLAHGWLQDGSADIEANWGIRIVLHPASYFTEAPTAYSTYSTGHVIQHHPVNGLSVAREGTITTNPRVNAWLQTIATNPHV